MRVVPDVSGVRREFDYLVPDALDDQARVGTEVRIALHGRRVGGWVVADDAAPPAGVTLRPLAAVRGWGPPPAVVDLARWVAWRWAGTLPSVLRSASPARAVRALPAPPAVPRAPAGPRWRQSEGDFPADVGSDFAARAWDVAGRDGVAVARLGPAADAFEMVRGGAALLGTGVSDPLPARRSGGSGHARRAIAGGAAVLVVVPERATTVALARRLAAEGHAVAVLPEDWARARAGGCVVVGTRTAALAPPARLAAAVVLDAHDQAHHQEQAPTWSSWAVVVERCRREGAPCLLVSPCPTLELLAAGTPVYDSRAHERTAWPAVEVVDRRRDDPRTGLYSPRLVNLVRAAGPGPGRRVLCVLNRTGRFRLLACDACGELVACGRCGGPMELGTGDGPLGSLRCRRCGEERPAVCLHCGSTRMRALRPGVSRVREELQALAGVPVAELTAEAGREGAVGGPDPADASVVVGTEAALHRWPGVDAVCFLDFDTELLAPRLHAGEEALALLARAARAVAGSRKGAVGRSPGTILVQTRQPDHAVVRAAVLADPGRLSDAELPVRRALRLPPFATLARISGPAADAYGEALRAAAADAADGADGADGLSPAVEVTGPLGGVWSLRCAVPGPLCDLLAAVARPPGRVRVEVDPVRV